MGFFQIEYGIYRHTERPGFYHRPIIGGRRTWRKLKSTTLTMARKEFSALKTRQLEAKLGVALDPYSKLLSVGVLAKEWRRLNCPDRRGRERSGDYLAAEVAKLKRLLPFWKDREAREIDPEDCRDYHAWRTKQRKKGSTLTLNTSVDRELQTVSNILHWAARNPRKTGLRFNPLAINRPKFVDARQVRHCTAVMPMTDEIFHQYAAWLLASDITRPLGWQYLLEGLTGARTREILNCRTDSTKPNQPGYQDETALHIHRLKKGIEPWALLEVVPGHAPLRDCLVAFHNWHDQRYAHCAWFIPGRNGKDHSIKKPARRTSLNHALRRASKELNLPIVTSHGLRAYYVRVCRSLGIDDSEISKRLGQRDPMQVKETYGTVEPGWFNSRKMDFLPDGLPAWTQWMPVYQKNTNSKKACASRRHLVADGTPVKTRVKSRNNTVLPPVQFSPTR